MTQVLGLLVILLVVGGGALLLGISDGTEEVDARRERERLAEGNDSTDNSALATTTTTLAASYDGVSCASDNSSWDSGSSTPCNSD